MFNWRHFGSNFHSKRLFNCPNKEYVLWTFLCESGFCSVSILSFFSRQVRHATSPQEWIKRQRRKKICRIMKWGHRLHVVIKGSDWEREREREFYVKKCNEQPSMQPGVFWNHNYLLCKFWNWIWKSFFFFSNRIESHYFIVSREKMDHLYWKINRFNIIIYAVFFHLIWPLLRVPLKHKSRQKVRSILYFIEIDCANIIQ